MSKLMQTGNEFVLLEDKIKVIKKECFYDDGVTIIYFNIEGSVIFEHPKITVDSYLDELQEKISMTNELYGKNV